LRRRIALAGQQRRPRRRLGSVFGDRHHPKYQAWNDGHDAISTATATTLAPFNKILFFHSHKKIEAKPVLARESAPRKRFWIDHPVARFCFMRAIEFQSRSELPMECCAFA